jgi:plastocyanin
VVEQSVSGPYGDAVGPCASAASPVWHFANGTTAREDAMYLALFNPFPDDAIVDLSFSTDQGRAVPSAFTGVVVRGGGLTVLDVAQHVRRRDAVAATVRARRGRVVAGRTLLRGAAARRGVSLALGAPSPAETWWFPDGVAGDGAVERLHVYNPGGREAQVDLELTLEEGAVEPVELSVAPGDRVTYVANDDTRVPKGVAHAVVVRSVNGVPVVAERTTEAGPPTARAGVADTLGARRPARRWAFAAGASNEGVDEWLVVHNAGDRDVRVSVAALASGRLLEVEGLQDVLVARGRRRALRLGDHVRRDDLALVVEATGPVVVERSLYRVGARGMSATLGALLP